MNYNLIMFSLFYRSFPVDELLHSLSLPALMITADFLFTFSHAHQDHIVHFSPRAFGWIPFARDGQWGAHHRASVC